MRWRARWFGSYLVLAEGVLRPATRLVTIARVGEVVLVHDILADDRSVDYVVRVCVDRRCVEHATTEAM